MDNKNGSVTDLTSLITSAHKEIGSDFMDRIKLMLSSEVKIERYTVDGSEYNNNEAITLVLNERIRINISVSQSKF